MAPAGRSYTSGYFALALDGFPCGILQKVEGGDIEGAVVNLPVSGDYVQKKQLGNLKYNDFKVACGLSMGKPLQDWIDASLAMNYMRKSGQIDAADFKKDTKYSREFYDALITEITMPACDGSAKDAAYLNLTFSPEKTRNKAGSGKVKVDDANVKQKIWYPANFRVTIPGLDTGLVAKVDALTVKQKNVRDDIGIVRDSQLEPAAVEYPNASFTVSEEGSDTWWKYHEDFVITGNNQETNHKQGVLDYLQTNLKGDPLLTLNLHTMGIFKGTADALENNKEAIRRVKFDFYMEQLTVGKWAS